jgi:ribosomal protein L13E
MSSDASAGARGDDGEYDWLLEQLDGAIEEAHRKVESGRVYNAENEKVRIKWIRALAYAVNVRRQVTNDRTLEELSERIDDLEARENE